MILGDPEEMAQIIAVKMTVTDWLRIQALVVAWSELSPEMSATRRRLLKGIKEARLAAIAEMERR